MSKGKPTPSDTPQAEFLSIEDSMAVLRVGRTRFYHLREEHGIKPVAWSVKGKKPKGIRFRREDVLKLASVPQGEAAAPVEASPTGDIEERLARARAKFITSFAHLPELPDFPSDKVLLEHYGG